MIELTEEMKAAVKRRMGIPDGAELDPWMQAAFGDVFAIVERDQAAAVAPGRWRCNRTERCFREDGHDGLHAYAGALKL